MQHLKGFGLENFRVFKEHTWFDFAPITLLIGQNSSGKSSLTKGLYFFKNITTKQDLSLGTDEDWLQLGDFERINNEKSTNRETITFAYPYYLNHFPTVGVKKKCKLYLEFYKENNQIRLKRSYIKVKNEVLLESSVEGLRFNIKLFNDSLYINEDSIKFSTQKFQEILCEGYKSDEELDLKTIAGKANNDEKYTCAIDTVKLLLNDNEELINKTPFITKLDFIFDFPINVIDIYRTKTKQEKDFWLLNWNDHREVLNEYKIYQISIMILMNLLMI